MFKSFLLELNISAVKTNYIFSVNSGDLNTIRLDLKIKDNMLAVDLTGKIVRLAIRKPDNTVVFQSGGVTDGPGGLCEFVLSKQAALVPGRHEGEVMIYEGDEAVAVTTKFYYEVKRSVLTNEDVESSSDFPAISQAIAAGEILKDIDIHSVIEAGERVDGVQVQLDAARQKEDGTLFGTVQERLNDADVKIDSNVAQLATNTTIVNSTAKKAEGTISMTEFPLIAPEVDDTARIKRAMVALRDTPGISRLTFQQKPYTFSGDVTGDISLTDKTIDGYGALFIDKRKASSKVFGFNTCTRVTLQNFMFTSAYDYSIVSNTIKDVGQLIIFDKQNDTIKIRNIDMTNIFGTGIWIAPRTGKPCTNIEIENITSNHLRKSTLYLSSIVSGTGYTPSEIKNITVKNLISKYCGAYYDVNGVSTRASESHWTAGVDFGEALSLLENANFSNCHVSYASESGFHCEGGVACVNVQFHNCSARFNGARAGAVYG